MQRDGLLSRVLMKLSPHDENKLAENTELLRDNIQKREAARDEAKRKSRDFIDMQLQIMRRK